MTQGPPGGNADDNNETVSIRRGDLPPGQPQYGQPPAGQYGQPPAGQYAPPPQSYGQSPQPYGAPTPPYHQPASAGRSLGAAALILALLGGVLAAVGFFAVRWTEIPANPLVGEEPKFLSLRKLFVALERLDTTDNGTFTIAYFKWAAFVLVGAALLFAILSSLPTGATPVFRVLGVIVGLLSAAAALFVPALDEGSGLSKYLSGGFGLYLVAGGSVLMAVGALIGSRRRG